MRTNELGLQRFVVGQGPVYETVLDELRAGQKRTHWMWFVFPQIAGLGMSATAQHYAISGRNEAVAYLAHPVLGPRLVECTALVKAVAGRTARQIFGAIDEMKFRSSMTLFSQIAGDPGIFGAALQKYFSGMRDDRTIELLGALGD
jgi:uncharacterized protein (DUF1810 family)